MNSSVLTLQRCFHHPAREAVARCTECSSPYCRECIAEHGGRIICAACLQRLLRPTVAQKKRMPGVLRRCAGASAGILLAWLFFYSLGRVLLTLPSAFHSLSMWGERAAQNSTTTAPTEASDESLPEQP